jgi:hypothetical protein
MQEKKLRNKYAVNDLVLPSAKDTQELLKDLEFYTPSEEETFLEEDYKNDILAFLSTYNVQPGKTEVSDTVLYYLYSQWSQDRIGRKPFNMELSKFFQRKTNRNKLFFLINQDGMSLSKAGFSIVKSKTRDAVKIKTKKRHFEAFLNARHLSPGDFFIEADILYRLYDKWTYDNKHKMPLGRKSFYSFLYLYFKCKEAKNTKYFAVEQKGLFKHVSTRKLAIIRKKNESKKKPKVKKEKQKRDKISRLRSWLKSQNALGRTS